MIVKALLYFKFLNRVILSIDLFLWYMRSLNLFLIDERLGPKILMINKMVIKYITDKLFLRLKILTFKIKDLFYGFLPLIGVSIVAFGITMQSILFHHDSFKLHNLLQLFNIAYWPIYGEISILSTIYNETCLENGSNEPPCLDSITVYSSYILLMIYMLFAGVMLINILIAMFR